MNKKLLILGVLLIISLLSAMSVLAIDFCLPTDRVLYIVQDECPKNGSGYNQEVVDTLVGMGFSVDAIGDGNLSSVVWSDYAFMVVGDMYFERPQDFPVNNFPAVLLNTPNLNDWHWTTAISSYTMSVPPMIEVENSSHMVVKNMPQYIQAYTQARTNSSPSINLPVYYLSRFDRAYQLKTITTTYTPAQSFDDNDATIALAEPGTVLLGGYVSSVRSCFFGPNQLDYLTADAQTLFERCIAWVAIGEDPDNYFWQNGNLAKSCGSGTCNGISLCVNTTGTWSNCSTKGMDAGVCASCDQNGIPVYNLTQNIDCNDNLYCNGAEVCQAIYTCQAGTAINCSGNNLPAIATCGNIPDNKTFTWDYAAGFTSACNEATDQCTNSTYSFTHTCDIARCGAECESSTNCANKCVGNTYYNGGICNTTTTCGCSYTTQNCDLQDKWYNTTTTQWIDIDQCNERQQIWQEYRDFSCSANSGCIYIVTNTQWANTTTTRYKPNGTACNDGLFCKTNDVCTAGICSGTAMNCSANNLPAIATCNNTPDGKSFTWDTAAGFTSTCDEANDICTNSTYSFTHACNKTICGAECVNNAGCANKCVGAVYYSGGTCNTTDTCACSYSTEDCDLRDGWYTNSTKKQWINTSQCTEKEQVWEDYRNYGCATSGCTFSINQTRWTDTGNTRNKADGTVCNDTLYCTVSDVCAAGICGGSARNCSANNITGIATCTNNPDQINFTWDFRQQFVSVCDEELDRCPTGNTSIAHTCDMERCNAECNTTANCVNKCIGDVYYYNGLCKTNCSCGYSSQNCNLQDKWYNTTVTQWVDISACKERQQLQQEYRDYSCAAEVGCNYTVNNTQWINTTVTRNKPNGTVCDDGLFCKENDVCTNGVCSGTAKNCSANNLPAIATCTNDPDNYSLTWDAAAGFTSTCNEATDSCTNSTYSFTHTCDRTRCGAECASNTHCANKCVGNVYYSSGTCNTCLCNYTTVDCDLSDGWYNTTTKQWVTLDQCNEKEQVKQLYRDYSCGTGGCTYILNGTRWQDTDNTRNKPNGTTCDDSLFCTTGDVCMSGECTAQPRDCNDGNECTIEQCDEELNICSYTNLEAGTLCGSARDCTDNRCVGSFAEFYTPDGHDTCNGQGACTAYVCNLTECHCSDNDPNDGIDTLECGAECDQDTDCTNKCIGDTYHFAGACDLLSSCSCSYTTEDCNQQDGWYTNDSVTQWVNSSICGEKEQVWQDYRDYTCGQAGCEYAVTNTQWVDTGNTRPMNDGTACDDSSLCTLNDVCVSGFCVGTPKDCSEFDLATIETCTNDPDNKSFTWDYAAGFTSVCMPETGECTTSTYDYNHVCDMANCGAECESHLDCTPKCEGSVYFSAGLCDAANTCSCSYQTEDCNSLDGWYNTTTLRWVESDQCNEKEQIYQQYRQYSCSDASGCIFTITQNNWLDTGNVRNKPDGTTCNDSLFCTTGDVCMVGECTAQPRDCNDGNECTAEQCNEESDVCDYTNLQSGTLCGEIRDCEDNRCTGSFAEFFTMDSHDSCDGAGTCVEYICSMTESYCSDNDPNDGIDTLECGAECDQDTDCTNNCVGDIYYFGGACDLLSSCSCSYETEDCNLQDNWYDTEETRWVNSSICGEKEQFMQEYRDYTCGQAGCEYAVTDTQWLDTGNTRPMNDGTACDDGLYCTVEDVCTAGICSGGPRDCSEYCLSGISSCTSPQDSNPFTFDFREAFDSYCDEELDICPVGDNTVTHTCSISLCGAECELDMEDTDNACGPSTDEGECQYGTRSRSCLTDCVWDGWTECTGAIYPVEELCDALDNDCDGTIDNGLEIACSSDADCGVSQCIDGTFKQYQCLNAGTCFAQCQVTEQITDMDGDGYDIECDGDCDDTLACVHPGAEELLNDIDENCINDAPVQISNIPEQSWPEDTEHTLDLSPYFMDPDGDALTFEIVTPADNIDESIDETSLVLMPELNWYGISSITVKATDGEFEVIGDEIALNVTSVNDAPVLDPISDLIVTESELVQLSPSASDVEGDMLTYSFTSPLNSSGGWQTDYSDSGIYTVTVSVDDGNGGTDSQEVLIQVLEFGNHDPVLEPIEDVVVTEGELVQINPTATDIDEDVLAFSFTAPLNSSGGWQTNYTDSGEYDVLVSVDDGNGGIDSQSVHITVLESGNHCPELLPISDITLTEGGLVNVAPSAVDSDGDVLTYSFTSPLNASGQWQTDFTDSGIYNTSVGVSDGNCVDLAAFRIIVLESGNHAPILEDLPDITIIEGEKVSVRPIASDPDNDTVSFSFSPPLDSNGEWQTDFMSQGVYTIVVSASDGNGGMAQKSFKLTVQDWGNHNPVLQPIADITVNEGELVIVTPAATDVDGDSLTYSFSSPLNASGKWKTNYSHAGTYPSSVTVYDTRGGSDTKHFTITVLESGNHAPIIEPIADISIIEGGLVEVKPKVWDPDGDNVTVSFAGVLSQDGTWQTKKDYIGDFDACVRATDGMASSERCFKIHVLETPFGALRIDTISMPETARPGETIEVLITTTNAGTKDLKSLRDRAFIDELGVYATSGQYSLKIGKSTTQRVYIDIPEDARPGQTYDIRFSISNDLIRRVRYRPITIVR